MFEPYSKVIQKVFPKAIHIVDRFHVVKLFTAKINIVRAKLAKKDSLDPFDTNFLKKKRKLFLMNPTNIEIYEMYDEVTKKYSTNKDIMTRIIHKNLELYDIHYSYELFLRIRFGVTRKKAEKEIDFVINILLNSSSVQVQEVGNSLSNWYEEILNYYLKPLGQNMTNGIAEGLNSLIKELINHSHGLKSFERMRKRVLFIDENRYKNKAKNK